LEWQGLGGLRGGKNFAEPCGEEALEPWRSGSVFSGSGVSVGKKNAEKRCANAKKRKRGEPATAMRFRFLGYSFALCFSRCFLP